MEGRRSTEKKIIAMVCLLCAVVTVHTKPSSGGDQETNHVQKTGKRADDNTQWKMDWWDQEENQEQKDGWKVFETDKKALKRHWWEENWEDDQWWAPKDDGSSSSKSSSSSRKYKNERKKGEDSSNSHTGQEKQLSNEKQENQPETRPKTAEPLPVPQTLPLSTGGKKLRGSASSTDKPEPRKETPEAQSTAMPDAESPWERPGPVWEGEVLLSPFEDPKPDPYPGPRGEGPDGHHWEHHQVSGLGRYIEHNHSQGPAKEEEKHEENQDKNLPPPAKTDVKESRVTEEHPKPKTDTVNTKMTVDQFYGFGLESTLSVPANELKEAKKHPQATHAKKPSNTDTPKDEYPAKEPPAKFNKDNYNKGVIYDVIPDAPGQIRPVKKNLIFSIKKEPSSVEYGKDFASTKDSLQTSPNPPPPDLAHEGVDSETTPVALGKKSGKSGKPRLYVKSRPLTFCKLATDCRKGRTCRRGMCVCLAEGECQGRKPVCGSDGVRYSSHCELHRAACLTRTHIKVDRTASCLTEQKETTETPEVTHHDKTVAPTTETTSVIPVTPESQDLDHREDNDDGNEEEEGEEEEYYKDEYYDEDYEEREGEVGGKEGGGQRSIAKGKTDVSQDSNVVGTRSTQNMQREKTQSNKFSKGDKSITKEDNHPGKVSKGDNPEPAEDSKSTKGGRQGSKGDYDYQSDAAFVECSREELQRFKRQLLAFYCQRFQEPDCKLEIKEERDYLSNLLFSYLDMDTDYHVSFRELRARQSSPYLPQLSPVCELTDLIWNDDVDDIDGRLSLQEFSEAFSQLYQEEGKGENSYHKKPKHTSTSSPVVNIIPTLATVGNGLELKCGLEASGTHVIWKRHGVSIRDLNLSELLVLEDGSLFFSKMGVHHMGNYSCQDVNDPSVLQVHSLKVQMPPTVQVSPHSQIQPSKADVSMRCHAEGVPRPTITWQMNNMGLQREPHRYSLEGNHEQLTISQTDYQKDTGAYKCVAKNQAGTAQDLASLFIIGDKDRTVGMGFTNTDAGKFVVFHDQGYTAYDPNDCLKHRTVHADFGYFKFIPDSLDRPLRLCEEGGECSWGRVVNVRNSLLYVTQPALNRVVVIETAKNWIPVQVIATDRQPMQVHYVPHLDQVWVVCWNGEEDSNKTMVVVRDASKYIQHRVVHTQPVGNRFDQIQALFIAPANDLHHMYDYGYVTHSGQKTLTKLDLDNMRYVNTIDLSPYDCVPRSLAFVPIGGHVVVECVSAANHQTLQLVLDYLTDAVVSTGLVSGRPHVSPDSRHVVTVDDLTGKVSVAGVSNEGTLEAAYEVTVSASISDVAFFPSLGHGYLLVLTSADDDDIITINLSTGKVDKLKGTNRRATSSDWYPSPVKRAIISGDVFSDFLLAPSKSSLSIMDMRFQQVQCEYTTPPRIAAAVFVRR